MIILCSRLIKVNKTEVTLESGEPVLTSPSGPDLIVLSARKSLRCFANNVVG